MHAIVLSGGPTHDFATTSARLAELLRSAGFTPEVHDDVNTGVSRLAYQPASTLLVTNLLRWTMTTPPRYADQAAQLAYSPPRWVRSAIQRHVERGGGLLAMHTAPICFDDWPEWAAILGARWDWQRSHHPPAGTMEVRVEGDGHPVVADIDSFTVHDECYGFLALEPDVHGLVFATHSGADHPLLWARSYGRGRVVYDALGHDQRSYQVAAHRTMLHRCARWAAGMSLDPAR